MVKGVFTCRICSTAHVTWREFSKHFLKHHGVEPKILLQYKCVPCDLLFQTKEVYLQHNRKCPKGFNQIIKISNTSSTDIPTSTDHICSILTQGALRNPGPCTSKAAFIKDIINFSRFLTTSPPPSNVYIRSYRKKKRLK